jgi:Sec-independent protein translocase protein TatA
MEFFGIGYLELLFIMVIMLLVLGPHEISKIAQSTGRFLNRLYKSEEWKAIIQTSRKLRNLPLELAQKAELDEIRDIHQSLQQTGCQFEEEMKTARYDIRALDDELQTHNRAATSSENANVTSGDVIQTLETTGVAADSPSLPKKTPNKPPATS